MSRRWRRDNRSETYVPVRQKEKWPEGLWAQQRAEGERRRLDETVGVEPFAEQVEVRRRRYARGSAPKQTDPRYTNEVYGGRIVGVPRGRELFNKTPADHRPIREPIGEREYDPVETVDTSAGIVWFSGLYHRELSREDLLDYCLDHWQEFSWGKQVPRMMLLIQIDQELKLGFNSERSKMITSRYFAAMQPNGWIVWDRHKRDDQIVAEFPRSAKGESEAREEAARLNREAEARSGIRGHA